MDPSSYSGLMHVVLAPTGQICEVNEAASQLFARSREELIRLRWTDLEDACSDTTWSLRLASLRAAGAISVEVPLRRKDATSLLVELVISLVLTGGEERISVVVGAGRHAGVSTLSESEAQLRCILASTADGILAVDRAGRVIRCNQRFIDLWRIPPEIVAQGDEAMLPFAVAQLAEPEAFLAKVEALYSSDDEAADMIPFKDGRTFERSTAPLLLNGANVGRVWSFRDVTLRERAASALADSHNLLQIVIDTAPVRVFWKDREHRYLGCNPSFAADAGMSSPADVVGKSDFEMAWAPQAHLYRADDKAVMDSGVPKLAFEEPQTDPNGQQKWLRTSKVPLRNGDGQTIGLLGIYEDITEQRRIERRLALAVEVTKVVHWEFDVASGALRFDPLTLPLLGFGEDVQMQTLTDWLERVHPDDLSMFQEQTMRALGPESRELDCEYRMRTANGEYQWIHSRGRVVLRDPSGVPILGVGASMNITPRKEIERAKDASERNARELASMLRRLCDNVPDMIWAKDLEKRYLFANKAICERLLMATDTDEPIGKTDLFFAHRERERHKDHPTWHTFGELCQDSDTVTLERGEASVFEEFGNVKGRHLFLEVHEAPFHDASGKVIGTVGSGRDVTERKQATDAIVAAREAAEAANRAKSNFLANMSHELRTPLNGVLGNIQLLETSQLSPEQREQVEGVTSSGKALLSLINDILELSKVEADRLELDPAPLSIRTCLESLERMQSARAKEKGLTLSVTVSADVPESVIGDERRLRQVILNLLTNSIKFTHQGYVSMEAHVESTTEDLVWVEFAVKDSGIGIREDLLERIFEPFVQADSSITRRYGGTGLGLTISRRFTQLMGGSIAVESSAGYGSRFSVRLPFRRVAAPAVTASTGPALRVWIVGGTPINQQFASAVLRRLGHQPVTLERIEDRAPMENVDLVIVDLQTNEGLQTLATIRTLEARLGRKVPTVAAMTMGRSPEEAPGFDGYVARPIGQTEISEVIFRALVQERR